MSLTLSNIQSPADLMAALSEIDITVPPRNKERKKRHTETYAACRLLSTLTGANRLTFPLSVIRRDPPNDRPDVVMHNRNAPVGIEITEAIPERFAALCAFAEKEFPDNWLPAEQFPQGANALSKTEMRRLLKQDARIVDGWIGNAPEREWASFMRGVVKIKLAKLANDDFQKFDRNWLSIYDNLALPTIHFAEAINILRPSLKDLWASVPAFDTVFIEHGSMIAEITASSSEDFVINDLWRNQSNAE